MCEYKDSFFFETSDSNRINSSLKQIEISPSNILIREGRIMDTAITAAFLLKSRAARLEHFRAADHDIDDISWHILLDLTVSGANEKPVTAHDLAITHNVAMSTMSRYVDYLIDIGMIEKNIDAKNDVSLKLTASGETLSSNALKKIGAELENF